MAESLKTILMSALTSKATPVDTDTMIVAEGNTLKKTTIAQLVTFLKEKLGINALNTKLKDKYVLARVDTVTVEAGSVPQATITDAFSVTFNRISDDAICIPICRSTGWLICTKYEINGNKLSAWFGCWSGSHSGAGTFDILQFVKAS